MKKTHSKSRFMVVYEDSPVFNKYRPRLSHSKGDKGFDDDVVVLQSKAGGKRP